MLPHITHVFIININKMLSEIVSHKYEVAAQWDSMTFVSIISINTMLIEIG